MTHQGNAAVHQHPPAVEYSRTRRSLSAATGRLSVSAILTIARSYRQPPLPRRTKKRPGDRPGRRGCRYSQQPTPNRMHRFVRIALQSKSWIQNMGNLLLWIRLARTGPMISGLLLFCSHRNFHFFFTSHTTFNLHFAPWYPPKCATDREKTLVLRTKVVFW